MTIILKNRKPEIFDDFSPLTRQCNSYLNWMPLTLPLNVRLGNEGQVHCLRNRERREDTKLVVQLILHQ